MNDNRLQSYVDHANLLLLKESPDSFHGRETLAKKAIELAIEAVISMADAAVDENRRTFYQLSETKELGPALVSRGALKQSEVFVENIKAHFGIQ